MSTFTRGVFGFLGGFAIGYVGSYSYTYLDVPLWVALPLTVVGAFSFSYYLTTKAEDNSKVI